MTVDMENKEMKEMKEYAFQVQVTSSRWVFVEASSTEEARSIVQNMSPDEFTVKDEYFDADDVHELD